MEKIEIKGFLGIKDISIEVKQINIFIGKQASGKSVIAKLLYYFKGFVFEIISAAEQSKTKEQLDNGYKKKFLEYFPPSSWDDAYFKVQYFNHNEFVLIERKGLKIEFNYSKLYQEIFDDMRFGIEAWTKDKSDVLLPTISPQEVRISFLSNFRNSIKSNIKFGQLYIPAGRSFFANLKANIFSILSTGNNIDPFLIEFGSRYERIKSIIKKFREFSENKKDNTLHEEIKKIGYEVMCGQYFQENGEDYLKLEGDRQVNMVNSSSGQQETLPLILILETISQRELSTDGISLYIEEPEAHIFPTTQKDIVELVSLVFNERKESLQFFLTTHSPYILTSFNNLLQAGMLATDADEEKMQEIEKLVPKSRFLKPEEVAVYSVEGGYCKSIMDKETGLIDANMIDEVSNDLAVQFDELLDLEE
ncbi:MAG: AAA family ATPase [Cyanobacteria bacterium J06643_13]